MTPDARQTEPMAAEIEKLQELITRARFVLFDFDGPICRLFAGHSAERVARHLVDRLEAQGLRGLLTEDERTHPDPQSVLVAVNRRHPNSALVTEVEGWLTHEEIRAVPTAWPTPFADPLIRTWSAVGARLAVVTNNSARTAAGYLASRGLAGCFEPHIYGRTEQLHLLKPHPHGVLRALNAMGAAPSDALVIGDQPTDLDADRRAGVPFLGYARGEDREEALRRAGATDVLRSLETVLWVLRTAPGMR